MRYTTLLIRYRLAQDLAILDVELASLICFGYSHSLIVNFLRNIST